MGTKTLTTKIISDENEHRHRLGYTSRQKATLTHSVRVDDRDQTVDDSEHQTIQQLSAQVETLTNLVTALMDQQTAVMQATHPKTLPAQTQHTGQPQTCPASASSPSKIPPPTLDQLSFPRRSKMPSCVNCSHQSSENCNHCFVCGDAGHMSVGCLKRTRPPGNGSRSLLRDKQRPFHTSSPTQ